MNADDMSNVSWPRRNVHENNHTCRFSYYGSGRMVATKVVSKGIEWTFIPHEPYAALVDKAVDMMQKGEFN